MADSIAQKLLLIGWDAADWEMIHPLLDAGRMPHLKRLIEAGRDGQPAHAPADVVADPLDFHRDRQASLLARGARICRTHSRRHRSPSDRQHHPQVQSALEYSGAGGQALPRDRMVCESSCGNHQRGLRLASVPGRSALRNRRALATAAEQCAASAVGGDFGRTAFASRRSHRPDALAIHSRWRRDSISAIPRSVAC